MNHFFILHCIQTLEVIKVLMVAAQAVIFFIKLYIFSYKVLSTVPSTFLAGENRPKYKF